MTRTHVLLVALALVLAGALLGKMYPDHAREYYLYITESRPDASLQFTELSEDWSEQLVQERFSDLTLRCYDNRPGEYLDDRSCFADVGSLNGHGAMNISFYFKNKKLNRLAVNVPWWSHWAAYMSLKASHGQPLASQFWPRHGVRLHGWQLSNRSAVFFNQDRPLNPLQWSGIFWVSDRQCQLEGCFK